MAFNRDRKSRPGGPARYASQSDAGRGFRPRFGDRGDRGPVEMHKAICDNCHKECEVPFRPTGGRPIFCSSCFENQRDGSGSRRSEGSPRFAPARLDARLASTQVAGEAGRNPKRSEERQMFNAVCADCGNACKVPFKPSGDKPVFCSNCFGEKKNAGHGQQYNKQLETLNSKLDKILSLLSPVAPIEKPIKVAKKKTSVTHPSSGGKKSPVKKN